MSDSQFDSPTRNAGVVIPSTPEEEQELMVSSLLQLATVGLLKLLRHLSTPRKKS